MLLRKAGYIGGIYREQYEKKTQNRFPVIELVLYWGKRRWNENRSVHEIFRDKKLPAKTMSYVDDLKLHVFELRNLPEKVRKRFQSDMRIVGDYLAEGKKDWTIISLFAQRDKESNGEEVVPDLETDVEEEIIHTITLQKLREVLTALPKEDVALLTALYLQTPPLTLRAYSEQTGIPVMTLHYRKEKLLQLLKKLL